MRNRISMLLFGLLLSLGTSFNLTLHAEEVVAEEQLLNEFDGFYQDTELLEQGRSLEPHRDMQVVQKRTVSRFNRHEFTPVFQSVVGGDPYLNTNYVGLSYQYHINPKWSLGLEYSVAGNEMSSEGDSLIDEFGYLPDMDWPENQSMATLKYYPLYGKLNFFNRWVPQFDVYGSVSAGSMGLKSGSADLLSVGLGLGLWLKNDITLHFDMRRQMYESQRLTGDKEMNVTTLGLGIGVLL